ncbi:MAG: hypothetical protein DRN96_07795 [Thermoproteota archaeon]|nr:MAG: hypothetical protein DRN96_07795 [Candidatus Korarchaeota archaeon]RLG54905.1 MAG: hypothetical protein DRN99_04290 [Candidatus Korarchaeota archaeon]
MRRTTTYLYGRAPFIPDPSRRHKARRGRVQPAQLESSSPGCFISFHIATIISTVKKFNCIQPRCRIASRGVVGCSISRRKLLQTNAASLLHLLP